MFLKFRLKLIIFVILFLKVFIHPLYADYPETIIGVIDLNFILAESKAAKDAAEKIEKIAIEIEDEIKNTDESLVNEQEELIESQQIMAPAVFEEKRKEYEKKVQNYNITRQEKLVSIDMLVAESRNKVLNALKPIIEKLSNEKGITVLLEKNSVLLNAENMDITQEALEILNKELSSLDVKRN